MTTILFCTEEETLPDIEVGDAVLIGVEDLCEMPRQMLSLVADDEKELVLAVHRDRLQLGALQAAARRLGFDPMSLGLLDLRSVKETACSEPWRRPERVSPDSRDPVPNR